MKKLMFSLLFLLGIISVFAQSMNYFGQTVEMINNEYYLITSTDSIPVDTTFVSLKYVVPVDNNDVASLESSLGLTYVNGDNSTYYRYTLPSTSSFQSIISGLNNSSLVSVLNYSKVFEYFISTPNDPEYIQQGTQSQEMLFSLMEMEGAWDYTKGDQSISIAVLDSGFDIDHPDIVGGSVDIYSNYDYTNSHSFVDNTLQDENSISHGTMVSSCVSAKMHNSTGIAAIAGGWQNPGGWHDRGINMIVFKISNDDNGPNSGAAAAAIYHAIDLGVDIISMSWGGFDWIDDDLDDAIYDAHEAGIIICAATGNCDLNVIAWPASHEHVIAVGGSQYDDWNDEESRWDPSPASQGSCYGEGLEIVAPATAWGCQNGGFYNSITGTSFSTPTVAGIIGLMKSLNPCLTLSNVREILHSTADKIGNYTYTNGWNEKVGYGRINARKALETIDNRINISMTGINTTTSFELRSQTGQLVMNGDLDYNKSFHSINIENIQPGIYSLLLFSNKNKVLSQKLSIQ